MNSLADLVFSPGSSKLEEPCESWWVDWYPTGHATPESLLYSKAHKDLALGDAAALDRSNSNDFWAANSLECFKTEQEEQEAVPCIAQDLELEIAELEQQAWSDSALSDLGVFCDDISFCDDGSTSFSHPAILRTTADTMQSWGLTSRRLPSLAVDVPHHRCKAERAVDSSKESSHGSARDGDSTPSSGDDASTHHSSFARSSNPKSPSTSAPAPSLPSPSLPTARPTAAAPARKPAARAAPPSRLSPASSGQHSSSSADPPSISDPSDVSSHRRPASAAAALPPPVPAQPQPRATLKRTSSSASTTDAVLLSPPAKVARIERPRREGSGMNSLILARCGADISSLSSPCSPAKSVPDGQRGKRAADATRSPAKGKGRGKAAGSPRGGKKRVPAKCAPPAPGVHACSQCGAQSTPVWRAGPFGPKTLCNACGVRYMKIAKRK